MSGAVTCPPSKSYTHRAIFLASLADSPGSRIANVLSSEDTEATIEACRRLGAAITRDSDGTLIVTETIRARRSRNGGAAVSSSSNASNNDTPHANSEHTEIDAANSGTTIRIAAGISALLEGRRVILTGDASLRTRPMQPLLDALSAMGATCASAEGGRPPLEVCGPILGGEVTIPGNISSQFVTSLFLCAPLTDSGMGITISDGMVSKPYLDATIGSMREFGVSVQTLVPYKAYRIAPQMIKPAPKFTIPSDASSLALLLAASALNSGNITINAMMGTLPQGDEAFIEMLESMGATIMISDGEDSNGVDNHAQDGRKQDSQHGTDHEKKGARRAQGETIRVLVDKGGRLAGGRFDLSNNPDLLPPLAITALGCSGPIEIFNVEHARLKETDRISILARELPKMGIAVEEQRDGLAIDASGVSGGDKAKQSGTSQPSEPATDGIGITTINSQNDHRLFMALCIAGMRVGRCRISDPDSVAVSYPGFIRDLKGLGADIRIS